MGILFGINVLSKIMSLMAGKGSQGNNAHDLVFLIFIFVYFIAMFKDSFNHMSMYGVTRKAFFITNSVFTLFASFVMVLSAFVFSRISSFIGVRSEPLLGMIYHSSYLELFAVGLCFSILAGFVGWLCSLLTYRFGNYMILIIIFVPQILMTVFAAVLSRLDRAREMLNFVMYYFGVFNGIHPLTAGVNLLLTAVVVAIINWLFMRKIPVKV
jgi:hypothetical protein